MQDLKTEVMTHYGGGKPACVVCGCADVRALCLDSIEGQHRLVAPRYSGRALYSWLKKQNYPSGWQTLCHNCNFIKALENNERRRSAEVTAERKMRRLRREKKAYRLQEEYEDKWTMYKFTHYIAIQPWYFFDLQELYAQLKLRVDSQRNLLRATCLKLVREGKLRRVGKGRYEKLVEGVNC